jgi:hypothetical protein
MSDAYGSMILSHTSKVDLAILAKALNRFIWNMDCEPVKHLNDSLFVDGLVQYPTSYPKIKNIYDEDTENYIAPDNPQNFDDAEEGWTIEHGDMATLEVLVKTISPVLEDGELHIITSSINDSRTIATGYLIINANHTATRMAIIGGSQEECGYQVEHYP